MMLMPLAAAWLQASVVIGRHHNNAAQAVPDVSVTLLWWVCSCAAKAALHPNRPCRNLITPVLATLSTQLCTAKHSGGGRQTPKVAWVSHSHGAIMLRFP